MYDFYPANETYTGNPEHVSRFCIRASVAEANRWGIELDEDDFRDTRDTMMADRAVNTPAGFAPAAKPCERAEAESEGYYAG